MKKEHTVESLRNTYKAIARLTVSKGMSKKSFKDEVEVEFREINDGEKSENELVTAVQYCLAARHVARMNNVSKKELEAAEKAAA